MKKVLIVAGGTGGHIFPALAVAEELQHSGCSVFWLGARYGLETKLVPDKYPMHLINMRGMRRSGLLAKLMMPGRLLASLWQSYRVISRIKPDVVLTLGGYVAAPAGIAAWFCRLPLVIHEQNSRAGLTNRLLARFAKVSFQAFPGALPSAKVIGNPVRKNLLALPLPEQRYGNAGKLKVLIIGGSQGARAINQCLLRALQNKSLQEEIEVWHQTGEKDFAVISAAYKNLPVTAKVEAFVDDMAKAYLWADFLICRAGALTVSEVAAVGVASLFIPYPFAVDNHQYYNAYYLSQNNAALLVSESDLTPLKLEEILQKFARDRKGLLILAQSARKLASTEAAKQVAECCLGFGN